jgi:hypothetical protein
MAVTEFAAKSSAAETGLGMTLDSIRRWCDVCDEFNEWQHKHVIGGTSSPAQLQDHRAGLTWLLRLTRLIHSAASDPEFPDPSVLKLLETKIWQLEQAWKLLYRPLSQPETDAAEMVLREVFPDEPRA